MIDIHSHLLYKVDDGAKSLEESAAMLEDAKQQGVDAMILTPHYRHGMFAYPQEKILEHFSELEPKANRLGIQIYLGTEYHVNSQIVEAFKNGRCLTMAGSDYVLTEYTHLSEYSYIKKMTQELMFHGYIPVIAHVERYACMMQDPENAGELREMGAWIQVNADAVLGYDSWGVKRFCGKLLKNGFVDVVASDCHGITQRASHMKKCQEYLVKKYGTEYAERLLSTNPAKIIARETQ